MIARESLKTLIDKIPDKRLRSQNGMEFCSAEGYKDLAQAYARQYLEVFDVADGKPSSSYSGWDHPGINALNHIPKEEREAILPKIKERILADATVDSKKTIGLVKKLTENYKLEFPELEKMLLADEILGSYRSIEDSQRNSLALDYAAEHVFSMWEKSKEIVSGGDRLLCREEFQKKYAENPIAREIASSLVMGVCEGRYYGLGFKEAEKLSAAYGLKLDGSELVRKLLKEGKIERAEIFSKLFSYTICPTDLTDATSKLDQDLAKAIEEGNIGQAVSTQTRLEAFREYGVDGLDVKNIPQVELAGSYGKFIVIHFKEKDFLRGAKPHEGNHSNILQRFNQDLKLKGFDEESFGGSEVAGAHYSIEGTKMTIKGKSVDFGECDKGLAKKLMSQVFQGEIVLSDSGRDY